MKKAVVLLMVLTALFQPLWANGGSDGGSDGRVTISYAFWDKNQEPGMQAMADAFMAENPDIQVELQVSNWGDYWTKLEAATLGGNMPDVFWMHVTRFDKYAGAGKLMPFSDMVAADPEVDYGNYPEGIAELYTLDGVNYGIPKDFDTIGLIYNKDLFDAAGLDYPDSSWTWDTLVEAAKVLTDEENGVYGFAAAANRQESYYNFILQNGGSIIDTAANRTDFDSPQVIGAIQYLYDMIHVHKVSPTVQQMADTKPQVMFSSGKVAMYYAGAWNVTWLTKKEATSQIADIAVLPRGVRRATVYNGLANAAAADTEHPEEVWRFVKFLGSREANLISASEGSAIPAFQGTQEPWINYNTDFNLAAFANQLEDGFIYPYSKKSPQYMQFEEETVVKILNNEIGVEEGCRAIAARINEVLASE